MSSFKGRVIKVEGSQITIDTTEKSTLNQEGQVIGSSWSNKEGVPKVNSVIRCNFHSRDRS
jgi:hypothetical protein